MGVFSRTSFEFAKVLSTELMYYIDFLSLFAEATSEGASQKVADRNGSGFMCDGWHERHHSSRGNQIHLPYRRGEDKKSVSPHVRIIVFYLPQ